MNVHKVNLFEVEYIWTKFITSQIQRIIARKETDELLVMGFEMIGA